MKTGIVGYGHVGKAMHKLFKAAAVYDKYLGLGSQAEINSCDAVFVCVPTPQSRGGHCDTSAVEEVIRWVESKVIVLRSTVYVGFTDEMCKKYKKEIVFQPEYYGETVAHPFAELNDRKWMAFGGTKRGIDLAIRAYQDVINSNVRIYQSDAKDVEMAKYMENAFLAMKVTFCNEMYDIAKSLGADYNRVREIWTADPRIGTSHTFVYVDKRGYGGSCLPKDIASIVAQAKDNDMDCTLLESIIRKNDIYKGKMK